MMLFNLLVVPLEDTVSKLDISHLKLIVVFINAFEAFLLVAKEMVNSIHTCLSINKATNHHHEQTHGGGNEIKYW